MDKSKDGNITGRFGKKVRFPIMIEISVKITYNVMISKESYVNHV